MWHSLRYFRHSGSVIQIDRGYRTLCAVAPNLCEVCIISSFCTLALASAGNVLHAFPTPASSLGL